MNLSVILIVIAGIAFAGAGVEGYLLKNAYEKQGALQQSLNTATSRLKEINDVLKEVDKVHATNNALPDDKLFDSLLPTPAGDQR